MIYNDNQEPNILVIFQYHNIIFKYFSPMYNPFYAYIMMFCYNFIYVYTHDFAAFNKQNKINKYEFTKKNI